jgi:hypothetical protein
MRLSIYRQQPGPNCTLGSLYIDGHWFCFTLEDPVRDLGLDGSGKIAGSTAIGPGHYRVVIDASKRFGRLMPHILNVPFFDGVRMHWGNFAKDTEGCPLLGLKKLSEDSIGDSRLAFDQFYERLKAGLLEGEVWIDIYNYGEESEPMEEA